MHSSYLYTQTVGLGWSFSLKLPFSTPVNFTHAPSNTGPAETNLNLQGLKEARTVLLQARQ